MTPNDPQVAHMVYFTLKDNSQAECDRLTDACKKYLVDHPGVVYFNCGVRSEDFARDVNDLEFDVSLTVVFDNKASHDAYQIAEKHNQFIEECKANWEHVRVFDSFVA